MSIVEQAVQRARETSGAAPAILPTVRNSPAPEAVKVLPAQPVLRFVGTETGGSSFDPSVARTGHLLTEIRALKRKVLEMTQQRRSSGQAPVVMVTSSVPGDGKSFISFHLALSLTRERNLKVSLVDGDVARQQSSRLFVNTTQGSLASCLLSETPLASALYDTEISGLSLIPAGQHSAEVSECLASNRWDDLIGQMRASGPSRIFVVDTAPVLSTSEAQYAARTVDLVLFVVRAEVTARQAVEHALARLGDLSRVAFVLNGAAAGDIDPYYDYTNYAPLPTEKPR